MVGYPLGTAIAGGDTNWALAGIGAGLIGVSIPFSSATNKNARTAVELYNAEVETSSIQYFNPEFHLVSNNKGIGILVVF